MWLDEINRKSPDSSVLSGVVTLCGETTAAETDCEHRDIKLLRAGGALRMPRLGERQLIMLCGDGEYVALGSCEGDAPADMEAGEVYIKTENAAVLMKNNGRIIVEGDVEIEGSLSLNGRLIDGA